ncbi:MAG: glycosyltransferase family 4 protein [PVC group bacterium]|nr:glycosyltransferase family 4 protein [PVC group bacterium]
MRKANIMHLMASRQDQLYGGDTVVLSILKGIDRNRFNCVVVAFSPEDEKDKPRLLKLVEQSGAKTDIVYLKNKFDVEAIGALNKLFKKYDIDVLHTHDYKSNLFGLVATLFSRVKSVTTIHGWLGFTPIKGQFKAKMYAWLDGIVTKWFDRVVAVSERINDILKQNGYSQKKTKLIYNALDTERFISQEDMNLKQELSISSDVKIIGTSSRLTEEKGHCYLLEAAARVFKQYPDAVLLIVGDGQLRGALEILGEKLNISDKMIFTGYCDNVVPYLNIMDVFVSASVWEGFGLSLLEAMSCGLPVVASNVGIVPEFVKDRASGLVVEPKDVEGIAKAIVELIDSKLFADNLGTAAQQAVRERFSLKSMIAGYEDVYLELSEAGK